MTSRRERRETETFERGRVIGAIRARLDEHDQHFTSLNGSIDKLTTAVVGTNYSLDRLVTQDEMREDNALATARALKEAEEARKAHSEQVWTPVSRVISILSGIAASGTIVSIVVLIANH